jgi:hypothetical protein
VGPFDFLKCLVSVVVLLWGVGILIWRSGGKGQEKGVLICGSGKRAIVDVFPVQDFFTRFSVLDFKQFFRLFVVPFFSEDDDAI